MAPEMDQPSLTLHRPERARLAVFVSGSGRSLANLITRSSLPSHHPNALHAQVHRVIASRDCKAADIASDSGIETLVIERNLSNDELLELTCDVDLSVLAGYLRLVPVPAARRRLIVNIHPALLPPLGSAEFGGKGMHGLAAHSRVLRSDQLVSGCTVHFADNTYDTGDVVLQRTCPILEDDTSETLAARVFELELDALPDAINGLLSGHSA